MLGTTTTHPMDAKGRVSLPAKHRKALSEELVIVESLNPDVPLHLRIYAQEGYDAWVERIVSAKGFNADDPALDSLTADLCALRNELVVDSLGRALIPVNLRKRCGLEKNVVIRGAGDHVQVWNPAALAEYEEKRGPISAFARPQ